MYVFASTTVRVSRMNEKLKSHIINLSQKHLELSRSNPQNIWDSRDSRDSLDARYPIVDPPMDNFIPPMIQYQVGAPDALRFYAPVENKYDNRWQKVGVAISVSTTDDTVFNFEQRLAFPFTEDNFEYRVYDTDKNIHFNVPTLSGKKLYNNHKFIIPGKESIGEFELIRDTEYRMIRM